MAETGENYVIFSNGLKMCWGKVNVATNNRANVDLPIAFSNTNYIVSTNHASLGNDYHYYQLGYNVK